MAFPLATGVTLADGRGGVLVVGRAEVLEDEGVTGAAGGVTGEELADHSSSKRPLSSSSRSSCGMQEHDFVFMNAFMFVSFADTCLLLCKPI